MAERPRENLHLLNKAWLHLLSICVRLGTRDWGLDWQNSIFSLIWSREWSAKLDRQVWMDPVLNVYTGMLYLFSTFYAHWQLFLFFCFFLSFGGHFLGLLVPLFWISGDISSEFQSHSGYIPQDPPLVLHMPPVLSPHTVVEVRLPGFELVLSEYLWVRRSTNWAKPGRTPTGNC